MFWIYPFSQHFHIIVWSLDFLNGRKHSQFVKIGNSVSNTTVVGARTPQGTVSGHNDFKLVINDLTFKTCYAKYVDDTTVLSVSKDFSDVTLQTAADHLVYWAQNNGMMINTNKTKKLIVCFNKKVSNTILIQYNTNKIYIAPGILKRIGAQTHGVTRR